MSNRCKNAIIKRGMYMTLNDLIWQLQDITFDTDDDPEVYIQIGTQQCRLNGISHFKEIENVCDEVVVLGDSKKPILVL